MLYIAKKPQEQALRRFNEIRDKYDRDEPIISSSRKLYEYKFQMISSHSPIIIQRIIRRTMSSIGFSCSKAIFYTLFI